MDQFYNIFQTITATTIGQKRTGNKILQMDLHFIIPHIKDYFVMIVGFTLAEKLHGTDKQGTVI